MATKVSCKDIPLQRRYEPGFEMHFGITDETTGARNGCVSRTTFPPKIKSKTHVHTVGEMFWYCISGKAIWLVGEEKKEYVLEPGDFIYIPPGEPHSTINPSETEPVEGLGGYFGCSHPDKSGKKFLE